MIKRPLCLMLAAYVAGIGLAWQQISFLMIIILSLLMYPIIYLLMYKVRNKLINRQDRFLWILPLLLLAGFLATADRLKKPELYDLFEQKMSCKIEGEVSKITENAYGFSLYLKDNVVTASDGQKYLCNKIIVKTKYKSYGSSSKQISDKLTSELISVVSDSDLEPISAESNFQQKFIELHAKQLSAVAENKAISAYVDSKHASVELDIKRVSSESDSIKLSELTYRIGNRIRVKGNLKKFSKAVNPGGFNEQIYYQIEDIYFYAEADEISIIDSSFSVYHHFLAELNNKLSRVYEQLLSDKEAGTLIAMLLGDRSLLDDEIKTLYQENGISHILAISGLHISLIGLIFFKLLRKLRCPIKPASIITIFFIYSYGVLTDFSVSTNRAIVMLVISLIAPITGKAYDMLSAICLSALIILLQNPMQLISAGFLLSYGAVLGIAVIYPALKMLLDNYIQDKKSKITADIKKEAFLKEAESNIRNYINPIIISVSTQLSTIPIVLFFFYQIPVYGIITNLLILPLIIVLILLALIGAIAGLIHLPLGVFIIGGASYILKLYEFICRIGAGLPANMLTVGKPGISRILIYSIFLAVFLITAYIYKSKKSLIIMVIGLLLLLLPYNNKNLELTFLDVGQGDAIYIKSSNNNIYLIDGGSSDVSKVGTYRITPFLLSRGKDVIDYAIITHADKDHISGLLELINGSRITIKNLILPDIVAKDEAYTELEQLAYQRNIPVSYISAGDMLKDGEMLLTCLHPVKDYAYTNSNSYSTVLNLTYGEFSALLTGDLEADGEKSVIKQLYIQQHLQFDESDPLAYKSYQDPDIDILKVAHHGSKNGTKENFLKIIQPEIAIISCGKNNRYGHPNEELLERLKKANSEIMITYESGAITIQTNGVKMEIEEYLHVWGVSIPPSRSTQILTNVIN